MVWKRNVLGGYAMCFVMYGTRATLPPLLLAISKERDLSAEWTATLLSSFSFGYVWLQIPGGYIAQRVGCRGVLMASIFGAAACMLAIAASDDLSSMLAGPVSDETGGLSAEGVNWVIALLLAMLGVCHAPTMPGRIELYARWIPPAERDRVLNVEGIGTLLGTLLFSLSAPAVAQSRGWRTAFGLQGATVVLLGVYYWLNVDSSPATSGVHISAAELATLPAATPASSEKAASFPLWLLTRTSCWAIIAAHTASNYSSTMLSSWTPTIFDTIHGLPPAAAAPLLALPPLFGLASRLALAVSAPRIIQRGGLTTLGVRRWSWAAYASGQVLAQLVFAHATDTTVATAALVGKAVADAPGSFNVGTSYLEVGGANSGVLVALGNTVANVGSLLAPVVGARIYAWAGGRWPPVFYSACGAYALATAVYVLYISTSEETEGGGSGGSGGKGGEEEEEDEDEETEREQQEQEQDSGAHYSPAKADAGATMRHRPRPDGRVAAAVQRAHGGGSGGGDVDGNNGGGDSEVGGRARGRAASAASRKSKSTSKSPRRHVVR
jgi:sugar phosphate permease